MPTIPPAELPDSCRSRAKGLGWRHLAMRAISWHVFSHAETWRNRPNPQPSDREKRKAREKKRHLAVSKV